MKLPRWLVATLIASSVLLVLGTAAWIWVTWPARTGRVFVEAMRAGDVAAVLAIEPEFQAEARDDHTKYDSHKITWQASALADVLVGRRQFRVADVPYTFIVERGHVRRVGDQWGTDVKWNVQLNPTPLPQWQPVASESVWQGGEKKSTEAR
jgi:hypothetical protein